MIKIYHYSFPFMEKSGCYYFVFENNFFSFYIPNELQKAASIFVLTPYYLLLIFHSHNVINCPIQIAKGRGLKILNLFCIH